MQRTADFHDQVADAHLSKAAAIVDNTAALDAAVDVLDAHAATRNASIGSFLAAREGSAPWLFRRHDDLDLVEREGQEAQILEQRLPAARVGAAQAFVMGTAHRSRSVARDRERGVDQDTFFTV
jgi:hypothetical protein